MNTRIGTLETYVEAIPAANTSIEQGANGAETSQSHSSSGDALERSLARMRAIELRTSAWGFDD